MGNEVTIGSGMLRLSHIKAEENHALGRLEQRKKPSKEYKLWTGCVPVEKPVIPRPTLTTESFILE